MAAEQSYSYVTNGVYTLDGSAGCLPAGVTFTGNAVDVEGATMVEVWTSCPLEASGTIALTVELSPDNVRWFDVTPSLLEDITQGVDHVTRIPLTTALSLRVSVSTNTVTSDVAAYVAVSLVSEA